MKHLCDLPIPVIRAIMGKEWYISEKLDGSYMRAGLDAEGRFYTNRKGPNFYYDVSDWPDLAWTNYFRSAHLAMEEIFHILQLEKMVVPGDHLDLEVIAGEMPNSINYGLFNANTLWITGGNFSYHSAMLGGIDLFRYDGSHSALGMVKVSSLFWKSLDGKTANKVTREVNWFIRKTVEQTVSKGFFDTRSLNLRTWLNRQTTFRGHSLDNGSLLDLKLNRKPEFITDEDWKANRLEIIAQAKQLREKLRVDFETLCNLAARGMKQMLKPDYMRKTRPKGEIEGVVVKTWYHVTEGNETTTHPIVFKMVDKEHFAPLNNFTHIVRYWLQGGRRPERPSFMSRTANWPVEKRLDRLEVLRRRYMRSKYSMEHHTRYGKVTYAMWDLDDRTMLLFAELRERILNGRSSVQGQSASDQ